MFLIEITIQVSFTSCCTAKRKKVVVVFFSEDFFSLAQLSYEYISLGFFAGFLFFLFCLLFVFPWICSLVVVFFSEPRGQKQKHYFFFSCLFCFLVIFFSF